MTAKRSLESINEELASYSINPIKRWIGWEDRVEFTCSQRGHRFESTLRIIRNRVKSQKNKKCFRYDSFCSQCNRDKEASMAIRSLAERGFTLLEPYKRSDAIHLMRCHNGHEIKVSIHSRTIRGNKCPHCRKRTVEEVLPYFEAVGLTILNLSSYIDLATKVEVECRQGHRTLKVPGGVVHNSSGCETCRLMMQRGSNNRSWNPTLTDEEREHRRFRPQIQAEWRKGVFERGKYRCDRCSDNRGGNLVAHHLYSYDKHRDLRLDPGNGVCLCESCHRSFHKQYGYGSNTASQYFEFKQISQSIAAGAS